eukprot:TRINITY_DN8493_c0_g1_i1.p1 TRINITY_DN8493_c0_g1~~TRINITY_DN8493_c0_g1_i1.p1  ORF type:complete len:112 (+),score=14.01 TRINITY_DN8493_c0_g1_i1:417-752(+)
MFINDYFRLSEYKIKKKTDTISGFEEVLKKKATQYYIQRLKVEIFKRIEVPSKEQGRTISAEFSEKSDSSNGIILSGLSYIAKGAYSVFQYSGSKIASYVLHPTANQVSKK